MKSPAPFVMSWNIQYLGSFTVHKITSDSLQRRMDKVAHSTAIATQFVYLSISLNGVYVYVEDSKNPFLAHSIRKICCVVGNKETRQVAYVTKRTSENGGSKKECHIFRTEISQQVEEIKSVLSSAFQRIVFVDNSTCTPLPNLSSASSASSKAHSETTISSHRSASLPRVTQHRGAELKSPSVTSTLPYTSTPPSSQPKQRQMSAAILFQRFFGATPKNTDSPSTPMRKPKDPERKRKRPVSAVFGQAMRHVLTPKKTVSKGLCSGTPQAVMLRDKMALSKIQESDYETTSPKKEPILEFDEKLGEFVFPIGQFMDDQLQRLAYFCNNPDKYEVYSVISQMPEGAFILRYSESRRRCLALSVRVPEFDGTKIAHYLIIRNEQGFRLKGSQRFFSSLPMLITHHTVLPELLPCRLIFVEWEKTLLKPVSSGAASLESSRENNLYSPPRLINLSQSPYKKHARRSFELFEN